MLIFNLCDKNNLINSVIDNARYLENEVISTNFVLEFIFTSSMM